MNYELRVHDGKVAYIARQKGEDVGSDARLDTMMWILQQGKPERSDEIPGYPIRVEVRGVAYYVAGEWLMGGGTDILSEDQPEKTQKKRRAKEA